MFNALTFVSYPQLTGQKKKCQLVLGCSTRLSLFSFSLLSLANNSAILAGYGFS